MNINAKKINAITGPWTDKDFHTKILPRFDKAGISTFRQEFLPLIHLYDDKYWSELRTAHRIDFAILDHHHWQYDDDVFDKYLERIASVRFPVLCVAECPSGFEHPLRVEPKEFAIKLFERTRKIVTAIREKHPKTIILSPGIGLVEEKWSRLYLDYFIHNRQYFDGYALHVCNDLREYALGQVLSFLNQVLEILPKKLWITKWAVPAFDGRVINTQVIASSGWEPFQVNESVRRLERSFTAIEEIAPLGSHWFYTGTGSDYYKPKRRVGSVEFWNLATSAVTPQEYSHEWEYRHFLGLVNSDGHIKEPLLHGLCNLAKRQNG